MSLESIAEQIQAWPFSAVIRGEDLGATTWIFPIIETVHIFALCIVFGSILMMDLRLLGIAHKDSKVSLIAKETLPWTWRAWGIAAACGVVMFTAKAVAYTGNFEFRMKFVCMGLAAVNMVAFHFGPYKSVAQWDQGVRLPGSARLAGAASIALWVGVVFFGRWVGFET